MSIGICESLQVVPFPRCDLIEIDQVGPQRLKDLLGLGDTQVIPSLRGGRDSRDISAFSFGLPRLFDLLKLFANPCFVLADQKLVGIGNADCMS